jgi:hypothetical protein
MLNVRLLFIATLVMLAVTLLCVMNQPLAVVHHHEDILESL